MTISTELEKFYLLGKNLIFRKDEMLFATSRSVVAWHRVGGDMGGAEWNTRGTRKHLEATDVYYLNYNNGFHECTHVKTHQNVHVNICSFPYVNYIPKLLFKSSLLQRIITKSHHPAKKSPYLFFLMKR